MVRLNGGARIVSLEVMSPFQEKDIQKQRISSTRTHRSKKNDQRDTRETRENDEKQGLFAREMVGERLERLKRFGERDKLEIRDSEGDG